MNRRELLDDLTGRIVRIRSDHPVRVAIDGVDASGKTTLANELVSPIEAMGRPVIRASIDRFHNPSHIRRSRGDRSAEGYFRDSFDYDGLAEALLHPLGQAGSRRFKRAIFDFQSDSAIDARVEEAPPDSVLLFDGVFLLRPELRHYWDLSIFVRADFATTVGRAEIRDADLFGSRAAVRQRYEERYVPGQQLYLSEATPEQYASVVVDNNDPARPTLVAPP